MPPSAPVRSVSNSNLPRPASSFVGRRAEITAVTTLLGANRLVTLTGPGGAGKTRLAIEAASGVAPEFRAGVTWVALADLRDPRLVPHAVRQALGTTDTVLTDHIGDRQLLLVLDNFERVVEAGPALATLLEACPNLKLIVTSREALRIRGEMEYPVPPLSDEDALALFSARSRHGADESAAELCRRLDNLPLAVELAAARTSVLTPAQILERLAGRLDLLRGGRDAGARQRTLRSTIEWSHDLLGDEEKRLFARLAVFIGGFTLPCAEDVAEADIDVLESLVDKNLVRHSGERFHMLETIHDYALERLRDSGQEHAIRSRHQAWFVSLVEASAAGLYGPRQADVGRQMELEFPNIRAAFEWCLTTDDIAAGLRLVGERRFWQVLQEHHADNLAWIDRLVERAATADPALLAAALAVAGDAHRVAAELGRARQLLERALEIQRRLADPAGLTQTLYMLGRTEAAAGNHDRASALTEEGVAIARAAGNRQVLGELLAQLGEAQYERGMFDCARPLLDEALQVAAQTGDLHTTADARRVLAMVECDAGRPHRARELLREALAIHHELCDWSCASVSLTTLGDLALRDEDHATADSLFIESLALQRSHRVSYRLGDGLWGLAAGAAGRGLWRRAARLLGAADALRGDGPLRLVTPQRQLALAGELRRRIGEAEYAAEWSEGSLMSREQAMAYALAGDTSHPTTLVDADGPAPSADPSGPVAAGGTLTLEGDYWTVGYDGRTLRLRDSKGLRILARLLVSPGRPHPSLDLERGDVAGDDALSRAAATGDAGELLDDEARRAYRARVAELREAIDEAESWGKADEAGALHEELDFITRELSRAIGLGGRARRAGSAAERARLNVTRAVKAAVRRIRESDPGLGAHLAATVRTGTVCVYTPDPRSPLGWRVMSRADVRAGPSSGDAAVQSS